MKWLTLGLTLVLLGCGVDGEPEPKASGINISGTAKIGVSGSF